jgi:ABC-type nitrate/sulfonate/bicarbonate transport system substrate-binding protein
MLQGDTGSASRWLVRGARRRRAAVGCLSRRMFLETAAGLVAAVALARPSSAQRQVVPLDPPVAVKVGITPVTSAAAVYLALDRGYFREEGLDVTLGPFDSGVQMIPLLGTGQLDVGSGAVNAGLFNAVLRGIPLRMVAVQAVTSPGHGAVALLIRKDLIDSGMIQTYADLRGRRLGLSSRASANEQVLDAALGRGGLTLQDVDVVEIPLPDMTTAFRNGSLDGAVQVEPTATASVELGVAVRWHTADELAPGLVTSTWIYSPVFADQRPEVGWRFMVGLLRGTRDYTNAVDRGIDREAVIETLIRNTPLKDRGLYDRSILPGLAPDGYLNADALQHDLGWYVQQGYVSEGLTARRLLDNQFVDYAIERLGPYR